MTTADILCLLCGSLIATVVWMVVFLRQSRLDQRIINHVRYTAYLKGLEDGTNRVFGGSDK